MALRAFKTCGHVGCPTLTKDGWCDKHRGDYDRQRADDELRPLYKTARWLRFRKWFLRLNPFCQRVWNGEQCHNVATEVHHRRGLREHQEDLCDAAQCCALCRACHHKASGDRGNEVYVPTNTGD
jgi:5-methylcytosine-specific restriction protein A